MIVDCLSCGATYNISDDKVRGRRVRVRCKSCGEAIIVDGVQLESDDATRVYAPNFEPASYGGGPEEAPTSIMSSPALAAARAAAPEAWTVNVSATEQRTMSVDDIVAEYGAGRLDDAAFVWKEGMRDWLPLKKVPEIAAALEYVETTRVVSPAALRPPQAQRPAAPRPAGARRRPGADSVAKKANEPGAPPRAPAGLSKAPAALPKAPAVLTSPLVPIAPPLSVPAAIPTQLGISVPPKAAPQQASQPAPPQAQATAPVADTAAAGPAALPRPKVTYSAPAPPPRASARPPEPTASVEYKAPPANRTATARLREPRTRQDLFGLVSSAGAEDELLRSESMSQIPAADRAAKGRNESSMLFSLDTLKAGARRGTPSSAPPRAMTAAPSVAAQPRPPSAPLAPSSAAVTPPPPPPLASSPAVSALPPPPAPPPPLATYAALPRAKMDTTPPVSRGTPRTVVVVGVVALAVGVCGASAVVFKDRFLSPTPEPSAQAATADHQGVAPQAVAPEPPPATSALATSEATPTGGEARPEGDLAPPEPARSAAPDAKPSAAARDTSAAAARPSPPRGAPAPKPDLEAIKAAIKSDDSTSLAPPEPTTAASPPPEKVVLAEEPEAEPPAPPFDTGAAKAALATAAAGVGGCQQADGPTGAGKAQVTFGPGGNATTVSLIGGDFAGTSVGNCIVRLFRAARVPAFSGAPVTVSKSFSVGE